MTKLTVEAIRSRLHTRVVGKRIICLDACESTNDRAWQEALDGAPDGTAVFAEEQSKGRGRFGRGWFAPKGTCVLCSVVLRPEIGAERVPLVTAVAALAVADAVEDAVAGVEAKIRFPNDVLVGGRKIAGVLVESRFISSRPDLFVVGIGLNVNVGRADLPAELRETATSLAIERGSELNRAHAARGLLEALDPWYRELEGGAKIRRAWRERSAILGRKVRVREGGRAHVGTVDDTDPIDGVVLRLESGHARAFRGEHLEHLELLP
jgi:BirA family biotin operon repressor/biotin-[acetyl-CoA-carboxylase] ligase